MRPLSDVIDVAGAQQGRVFLQHMILVLFDCNTNLKVGKAELEIVFDPLLSSLRLPGLTAGICFMSVVGCVVFIVFCESRIVASDDRLYQRERLYGVRFVRNVEVARLAV